MADGEELEEVGGDDAPSGKGKIIIFAVIGLVLVAVSVGATLFMLGTFDSDGGEAAAPAADASFASAAPTKASAIYFPLRPPMIVAFPARGRQRFLQIEITLMSREQAAIDAVQFHLPRIRNNLTMLMGAQDYEHLQTILGKEELRTAILEEVQTIMMQEIKSKGIEDIYFTNMVMQ